MKTQIQSVHFDADEKLLEFIEAKMVKLYNVSDRIESSNIVLRLDRNSKDKNKFVEITLDIPGNRLFAKDQAENFEIAFNLAVNEIKKQLLNRKDKISEKERSGLPGN